MSSAVAAQEPAGHMPHSTSSPAALAEGADLLATSDPAPGSPDRLPPALYSALVSSHRAFCLSLEASLVHFAESPTDSFQLPPMSRYHRLLAHQMAEYYGLRHSLGSEGSCVLVFKGVKGDQHLQALATRKRLGVVVPVPEAGVGMADPSRPAASTATVPSGTYPTPYPYYIPYHPQV